jgi:hypothetical protein
MVSTFGAFDFSSSSGFWERDTAITLQPTFDRAMQRSWPIPKRMNWWKLMKKREIVLFPIQEIEIFPYEFRPDSPWIGSKFLTTLTFEAMLMEFWTNSWWIRFEFIRKNFDFL